MMRRIGRTHRGTLVALNPHVAFADLIIGLGQRTPHPIAGWVVDATEGLSREMVKMMKWVYSSSLQAAVNLASESTVKADVAISPSGGNIVPEIR